MNKMDKDYLLHSGILPQYAHLKGMAENMPVIRKLLGLSEYGRIPTETAIGRAVQRFIENSGQDVMCESVPDQRKTLE